MDKIDTTKIIRKIPKVTRKALIKIKPDIKILNVTSPNQRPLYKMDWYEEFTA
jgi:hypothetical protein